METKGTGGQANGDGVVSCLVWRGSAGHFQRINTTVTSNTLSTPEACHL